MSTRNSPTFPYTLQNNIIFYSITICYTHTYEHIIAKLLLLNEWEVYLFHMSCRLKVGSNFQRRPICMNDVSNCSSCHVHFKNVYFDQVPTCIFEIITFKQIRTVILEQEVPMCKLLIFQYRNSINKLIPMFTPNVPYSKHTITLKI